MTPGEANPPRWQLSRRDSDVALELSGDWVARETGVRSAAEVRRILTDMGSGTLRLDVSHLGRWDSALVAFLKMLHDLARAPGKHPLQIDDSSIPETVRRLVDMATVSPAGSSPPAAKTRRNSLAVSVGNLTLELYAKTVDVAALVGEFALESAVALRGRTYTRVTDVLHLVREAGVGALGIVAIVNGLVGAILAFVGAVQLRKFGAGIYVANLVGVAVAREMAAIVTAIVMAGRTGGAYAAHLATMQGNEEIDALNVLGVPVFDFLILPRILALVTMMPLLYLYACAVALVGGLIVSLATLGLTSASFLQQLREAVSPLQFYIGLIKSIAFGALVALAGCHVGIKAGRSAADVGRAATTATVTGIVGIIALDAVFAVCANALGI